VPEARARAKRFEYDLSLGRDGRMTADGATLSVPETWSPEHLVLAGLVHCSLTSLRYHALRAEIAVEAEGSARCVVTRRESDDRYAFVELECRFEIALDPKPGEREVGDLLARAERDCFVGASLQPPPRYVWNVT
jgi:organic hydroperoxide reductase OsmC/OhrA